MRLHVGGSAARVGAATMIVIRATTKRCEGVNMTRSSGSSFIRRMNPPSAPSRRDWRRRAHLASSTNVGQASRPWWYFQVAPGGRWNFLLLSPVLEHITTKDPWLDSTKFAVGSAAGP